RVHRELPARRLCVGCRLPPAQVLRRAGERGAGPEGGLRRAGAARLMAAMRILVCGAGAVGGYFGARLALGGHAVTFVARGATLVALRARGLSVRLATEALRLAAVRVVEDPAAAESPDIILVCVKSHATAEVAAALRPAVRPDTIVLSLQNGIE